LSVIGKTGVPQGGKTAQVRGRGAHILDFPTLPPLQMVLQFQFTSERARRLSAPTILFLFLAAV